MIIDTIAQDNEKADYDDKIEVCQAYESIQEFNGNLTKRLPVQDERFNEVNDTIEPENEELVEVVSCPCPPNSDSDMNSNDPSKDALDSFRDERLLK